MCTRHLGCEMLTYSYYRMHCDLNGISIQNDFNPLNSRFNDSETLTKLKSQFSIEVFE